MRELPLSELPNMVGQEIGVSDWLEITQERVNRFADATVAKAASCGEQRWKCDGGHPSVGRRHDRCSALAAS